MVDHKTNRTSGFGPPVIRIILFGGLYWGPPNFGKPPYVVETNMQHFLLGLGIYTKTGKHGCSMDI